LVSFEDGLKISFNEHLHKKHAKLTIDNGGGFRTCGSGSRNIRASLMELWLPPTITAQAISDWRTIVAEIACVAMKESGANAPCYYRRRCFHLPMMGACLEELAAANRIL
jgi:hypothetical protein